MAETNDLPRRPNGRPHDGFRRNHALLVFATECPDNIPIY
jgi:hypothetical protein